MAATAGPPAWRSNALSLVVGALALLLAACAAVLAIVHRGTLVDAPVPEPVGAFVAVQIVGVVVWTAASWSLRQRRDLCWSLLAAIAALGHAVAAVSYSWVVRSIASDEPLAGVDVAASLVGWPIAVEVPVVVWMLATLPTGRLGHSRLDRAGVVAVALAVAGVGISVVGEADFADTDFDIARNPLSLGLDTSGVSALLLALSLVVATIVLVVRWRHASGDERAALRLIVVLQVLGTTLLVPLVAVGPPAVSVGLAQVSTALFVLALVTVVLRHRLLGIERLFERSLRFALLFGLLFVVYAGCATVGVELVGDRGRSVAAVAVALSAVPLSRHVGRAVHRFVYGHRVDADDLVRLIAARSADAAAPTELLRRTLEDLATGARLAGAAVLLEGGVTIGNLDTSHGASAERIELRHRGEAVGELVLVPGYGELVVDPTARALAVAVAPHMATLAAACRVEAELQRSREQLVQAREEERRRLRRDLHDGIGPLITGVALSTDAASNLTHEHPERAVELLALARHDLSRALDEIRRIVDDLRPPAIDELGLPGALRQHAARLPQLDVSITAPEPLPELPAAVEVAAYRIVSEAITNVVRHSDATSVAVSIRLEEELEVAVLDDGSGQAPWVPGVGLRSMHDRVSELGGTVTVGARPGGGSVVARIPVVSR